MAVFSGSVDQIEASAERPPQAGQRPFAEYGPPVGTAHGVSHPTGVRSAQAVPDWVSKRYDASAVAQAVERMHTSGEIIGVQRSQEPPGCRLSIHGLQVPGGKSIDHTSRLADSLLHKLRLAGDQRE